LAIILIMGANYRPMYFGANNRLFFYENTKVLVRISLIAGIANVVFNAIFIPVWGYKIAAYTTFICLMYIGSIGYYVKPFKDTNPANYYTFRWLMLTVILTIAAYFMVQWNWMYKGIITLVTLLVAILGVFKLNQQKTT
ncbi:MAG TPA: hypothetical protein VFD78_06910, partial [Chitinophagaceae bacterium]|nr:hypothetical protein [Chitinophagaceae bacterium]